MHSKSSEFFSSRRGRVPCVALRLTTHPCTGVAPLLVVAKYTALLPKKQVIRDGGGGWPAISTQMACDIHCSSGHGLLLGEN
jgi:hypothetical protein